MSEHTAQSAADYLAALGYTVGSGRIGGRHAPKADTIRRWCKQGKIKARRVGYIWLIAQADLDALLAPPPPGARGETEERTMNEQQQFQQAIDDRDWFTVTRMVAAYTTEPTTDEHGADELQDWLSAGDWSGDETPQSVAAEWDKLCRDARNL